MKNPAIYALCGLVLLLAGACQNAEQVEFNRYYSAGVTVYQQHCQNCHGENGEGLAAMIPPITDSKYLTTNGHKLACYIQNGLKDTIVVNGKTFEGQMPAAGISVLETAQVLTYIKNSFGNRLGKVDNDAVLNDLKNCK